MIIGWSDEKIQELATKVFEEPGISSSIKWDAHGLANAERKVGISNEEIFNWSALLNKIADEIGTGSQALYREISCWMCGLDREIPNHWEQYYRKIYNKEYDPEFQEYLRLKDKFE